MNRFRIHSCFASALFVVVLPALGDPSMPRLLAEETDLRVGASAVNLVCDESMVLAGMLEARFTKEQEGELRSVAVVVERPGEGKVAIVACDVLWIPRDLADAAVKEIETHTGIDANHVLINATHTHHAPSPAPAHGFGVSEKFREILQAAIVQSVREANERLAGGEARFYFQLGEEKTIGANSRLQLDDGNITWLNPLREAGDKVVPTGPFDPELPVLDFRDAAGKSRAIIFNHSTHTIGTRSGGNVRSPGFYGLAAQELERDLGGVVSFLEGASGSTHNIAQVPVDECIARLKRAVTEAREKAAPRPVARVAGLRRPLKFRVRHFDDAEEDAKILRYTSKHAPTASDRIREVFSNMRRQLKDQQGQERETWIQAIVIGDVAIVGVPAEYFTGLGVDIKNRSPFEHTYVAELANDWIGYLPDREGHRLGGYQTWMGLHSYAEEGTGERVADEAVSILEELAKATESASPQTPEREKNSFRLSDPELEVELVAAEPDVVSPVAVAWDEDGRMFVAEMFGYPTTENSCRIALLEDRDGDGRYSRTAIFADGLSFVNGVMPFQGGLLATAAPDILFLKDTNGDGQADERKVLWTGFGTGSQQLRANSLHLGIDNWIYGANGRCDGEIRRPDAPPAEAVSIRARDFRFHPVTGVFEAITGQSQFGMAHDDWGRRFLSWNTIPIRQVVIDDRYLKHAPELASEVVKTIADPSDSGRVFPISKPPRQFNSEQANYYNAMCGLTIYRGDQLGPSYAGNAFIGESLTNLVTRRVLEAAGPSFISKRAESEQDREFLASTDNWFHPVNMTTAPDGSLVVVDFYREFVEHPIYVADLKARAETDWRVGAEHGRIWRIRRKGGAAAKEAPRKLSQASIEELVALLEHPVGWQRDTAQRLLVERGDAVASAEALRKLVRESPSPLARSHALWTLHGLNAINRRTLLAALEDSHSSVRRQALLVGEDRLVEWNKTFSAALECAASTDTQLQFQAVLTLGHLDDDYDATDSIADRAMLADDRLMQLAVLCGAATAPWKILERLAEGDNWTDSPSPNQARLLAQLGEQIGARNDEEEVEDCLGWLSRPSDNGSSLGRLAVFAGLVRRLGRFSAYTRLNDMILSPFPMPNPRTFAPLLQGANRTALDGDIDISHRLRAIDVLAWQRRNQLDPEQPRDAVLHDGGSLLPFLLPGHPPAIQAAAARGLADLDDADAIGEVYTAWSKLSAVARQEVIATAPRSRAAAAAMLSAIEGSVVAATEVPSMVRLALVESTDPALKDRAAKLLSGGSSLDRESVVNSRREAVRLTGDQLRGALLFKEHCLTCHAVQNQGGRVGPELAGVGGRTNEILLVDILDPSRQVTPDFVNYVASTTDGRVLTGLIVSETEASLTLRRAGGEQDVVAREDIEELRATGKSIMPDGFEEKFSPQQLADVIEFLRRPDRELLETR